MVNPASSLLFGRRPCGSGPRQQNYNLVLNLRRDLIKPLDHNRIPFWMQHLSSFEITKPASIGFVPGLDEGEMVHRYFISGFNDKGTPGEMVFVRDGGRDYLTFSYRDQGSTLFGGQGERGMIEYLGQNLEDDLIIEFASETPAQTTSILDIYRSEEIVFGAPELGAGQESQQSTLAHIINRCDSDFDSGDREMIFALERPGKIAAVRPELLERLHSGSPLYLNIPLAALRRKDRPAAPGDKYP